MVGLVLGGGAALGVAHIGVIRVLEKENIQKLEALITTCREYFNSLKKLNIAGVALLSSEKNNSSSSFTDILFLLMTFPVFLMGIINNYLPIKLSVILSKMISKRPVFWRSTDMAFSILTVPAYYFIIIRTLAHFTNQFQPASLHLLLLSAY